MSSLTPAQAVARLFSAARVELELEGGRAVRLQVTAVDDTRVFGLAAGLHQSTGRALIGRVLSDDQRPLMIALRIVRADTHTRELARVELRATRVDLDTSRRTAPRQAAGGIAWLTAISCGELAAGERVDGTLTDLSMNGVGFATARPLRVGDQLEFHGRFFAEEIDADVRIASLRGGTAPGRSGFGARFMQIDGANRARIEHILAGVTQVETAGEPDGWRRLFRRDA